MFTFTHRNPEMLLDKDHTALVLADIQNEFLPPGDQPRYYALVVSIPNVYFHIMAAYAILRHNGVDIGKMDFLGPINWTNP
jgi:hypothetical protein